MTSLKVKVIKESVSNVNSISFRFKMKFEIIFIKISTELFYSNTSSGLFTLT